MEALMFSNRFEVKTSHASEIWAFHFRPFANSLLCELPCTYGDTAHPPQHKRSIPPWHPMNRFTTQRRLSSPSPAVLLSSKAGGLADYLATWLPCCLAVLLSCCLAALLSCCLAALLPACRPARLPLPGSSFTDSVRFLYTAFLTFLCGEMDLALGRQTFKLHFWGQDKPWLWDLRTALWAFQLLTYDNL